MNQRAQNEYLRVNRPSKNIRKSHSHQRNASFKPVPQPPQPKPQVQVFITNKKDFKGLVQRLTGSESCQRLPQNLPKHEKIIPEPINPDSTIPLCPMAVQEDPDVLLYARYVQCLLEDSSGPNGYHFQQLLDEYHSHMLAQSHFQPQAPNQSMPQSNGVEPIIMPATFPSSCFNGSLQQMQDAYSLRSTRVEYPPQPLTPNFTSSSMDQPGVLGPYLPTFSTPRSK